MRRIFSLPVRRPSSIRTYSAAPSILRSNGYLVDSYDQTWSLSKSNGSTIIDAETSEEYLDFHGGFGSNPIGWNHPKLVERMKDVDTSIYANKPACGDFYTEPQAAFVEKFKTKIVPDNYDHLFFIDGGALAVENALKIAMDWKTQRTGIEDCSIIHFKNAFHGRSGYTMSLTNTDPHKIKYFPKFNWPRIETIVDLENIIAIHNTKTIAALIYEPVRCEGGDLYHPKNSLKEMEKMCIDNDILLIADEVQTGFGSSGKMWCHEHYNLNPDLVVFGKKTQQCGVFGGNRIDQVEENCFINSGRISSTWSGNLVDQVRASNIIDIVIEDDLVGNAETMGKVWNTHMQDIHDPNVSNVRNKGLIMAFDCQDNQFRNELVTKLKDNGLLALSCGENTVRFRPNLAVNEEDILRCVDIVKNTI